jgi:uncharacterized protein DUF6459
MSAPPIPAAAPPPPAAPPGTTSPAPLRPGGDTCQLRLVVVRTPGPPLEDERVPVRLLLPGRHPRRPIPPPGPRPRMDRPVDRPGGDPDFGPTFSRRADLPAPGPAAHRLVTIALEAFAGRRPMAQLRPVVTPALFTVLAGRRPPRWCAEGGGTVRISSVRVSEPVDGVAEVSAVARRDGRAHAVAARMEGIDGQWRCTALQVG